jgi:hypothetical protein
MSADADRLLFSISVKDNVVHGKRYSRPLVMLNPAVVMGVEDGKTPPSS